MRNLELDTAMIIKKKKISFEITKNTGLDDDWIEWDLRQLTAIVTTTSIEDSKRREDLIRKKRNQNVITGAVIGGIIDASNGNDSILDGVLFGSIAGAAMSRSPHGPVAQIGLLFADGEDLALEVNKKEYTKLQAVLGSNKVKSTEQDSPKDSITVRKLTNDEKELILSLRQDGSFTTSLIIGALMLVLAALIYNGFYEKILDVTQVQMQDHFKYYPLMLVLAAFFSIALNFFKSKDDFYQEGEQKLPS